MTFMIFLIYMASMTFYMAICSIATLGLYEPWEAM